MIDASRQNFLSLFLFFFLPPPFVWERTCRQGWLDGCLRFLSFSPSPYLEGGAVWGSLFVLQDGCFVFGSFLPPLMSLLSSCAQECTNEVAKKGCELSCSKSLCSKKILCKELQSGQKFGEEFFFLSFFTPVLPCCIKLPSRENKNERGGNDNRSFACG